MASEIARNILILGRPPARDFSQDGSSVRVNLHLSGSTLSRSSFFDIIAEMSSCPGQLPRTLLKSKNLDRESVEPEVGYIGLVARDTAFLLRAISEAVYARILRART